MVSFSNMMYTVLSGLGTGFADFLNAGSHSPRQTVYAASWKCLGVDKMAKFRFIFLEIVVSKDYCLSTDLRALVDPKAPGGLYETPALVSLGAEF